MTDTAQTLIEDALKELGAIQVGESITDDEAQDALRALNYLLDSQSLEHLYIYDITTISHTLTVNDGSYTIGSGGDIATTRPVSIRQAWVEDTVGSDTVRYPLQVIKQHEWNLIQIPTTTSNLPDKLFYDPQFPLGVVNLYPVPTKAVTLKMDAELQLSNFSALTTTFSMPLGYYRMLKFNLAIEIAAPFGLSVPRRVEELARMATSNVKRRNSRPPIAQVDPALRVRGGHGYNIFRGD